MKSIYVRNLFRDFFKKKKVIIICLIIFILGFGCLGVRQAYPEKVSSSLAEEVEQYEAALQNYDDAIANIQENVELTQNQVDRQQTYCDESVYMQIDPSNVQVISAQYMIKISDMSTTSAGNQITYLLNVWTTYITSGSLKAELAEELGNISTDYLAELISTSTAGNTLILTVRHYDMDQAREIMEALQKKIDEYRSTVEESLGSFEMLTIDYSEVAMADVTVQNTQNTNLNNLRTYKNSLTDYKTKLVAQQTARNNYAKQYKPTGVSTGNPKKTLLEYGALGVLAGILIPFAVYALQYTLSGRVKNKEELLAAELTVLSAYNPEKGFDPSADRVVMDIQLLAKQNAVSAVCLKALGDSDSLRQIEHEIHSRLEQQELNVLTVNVGQETPEQMQEMAMAGNSVLLVEAGRTTYTQVEEQMQFCRRFNISVWGCIIIE